MNESDRYLQRALEAIKKEKAPLIERLRLLTERETSIQAMLTPSPDNGTRVEISHKNPLVELIDRLLVTRPKVFNEEVKRAADQSGIPYKDGRSINAIFIGLKSRGEVERTEDGGWSSTLSTVNTGKE